NLWFTEFDPNMIAMFNPTTQAFTELAVPTADSGPFAITAGPDGNLWFTENNANNIGQVVIGAARTGTTTLLVSQPNPSDLGQPVTFTATVTAATEGAPTGAVTFVIDGQAQAPVPLSAGEAGDQATFSTSMLTAGPH